MNNYDNNDHNKRYKCLILWHCTLCNENIAVKIPDLDGNVDFIIFFKKNQRKQKYKERKKEKNTKKTKLRNGINFYFIKFQCETT